MVKTTEPLVSIVTPVYNGESYLDECIRSVLQQTYQNWEYIILNNCSTDRTLEIAQKYAVNDKRIHIHNTTTLLPIMKNWNHALSLISPYSEYCKVVHADDLLFSQCLKQMVSVAQSQPTIGIVGSYGLWGDRVVCRGLPEQTEYLPGKDLCRLTLLNRVNCFWSPSSLLIRSDLIRKRHEYYDVLHLHADVKACYETLKESDFGFVHQILTFIRKHEESVTSTVAAPYNRFIVDNLDHLVKFGSFFLNPSEYNRQLSLKTKQYYSFLAKSLIECREKSFWHFHQNALKKMGKKLNYFRLIHTAFRHMVYKPFEYFPIILKSIKQRCL